MAGRYRLVVSVACPWAHRSVIDRELLGLTKAISLGVVDPIRDDRGWRFTLDDGGVDRCSAMASCPRPTSGPTRPTPSA